MRCTKRQSSRHCGSPRAGRPSSLIALAAHPRAARAESGWPDVEPFGFARAIARS